MGVLHCYLSGFFLCCRYFGSVEGSKFVEMASVDNVKRTWVNYGGTREWSGVQGRECRSKIWKEFTVVIH